MYQKQIDRKELSKILASVSGGLASKDLVPILSSFCFEDGQVTTFDDVVTVSAPCPVLEGFEGALNGKLLTDWLNRQKAESIKITVDGTEARFNYKSSRVSIPVLSKSDFQYQIPDVGVGIEIKGDSGFTDCVIEAARSLGTDPAYQWRMGVTAAFEAGGVDIYGSDNVTCVRASCTMVVPHELIGRRAVLPPRLVELVKKDKAAPLSWYFLDNVVAVDYAGDRSIYCRTLGAGELSNHEGPFESFDWDAKFAAVPSGLNDALQSVQMIFSDKADARCTISFNGPAMIIEAKSNIGEVHEELSLGELGPDLKLVVSPTMLQRCLVGALFIKFKASGIQLTTATSDILCSVDDGE